MKILVINLMHLGDLMLVTPTLCTLRKNFPTAHLALLADKKLADLVQYNKHLDECILIDKTISDLIKMIPQLRAKNFDLVINLHRNERASALAAFSGGKKLSAIQSPASRNFLIRFCRILRLLVTSNAALKRNIFPARNIKFIRTSTF